MLPFELPTRGCLYSFLRRPRGERHASDLKSIDLFANDFYKDNNDNSMTDPARGFNLQVDERISDCESNAVAIVDKSTTSSCPK